MFGRLVAWAHTVSCAIWAELIRNPRLYALLAGQPILLGTLIWATRIVADPHWGQPVIQLDILKLVVIILGATHGIVAIATAAVRVKGTGPGGFSLDVSQDDDSPGVDVSVEAKASVKPET